MPFDPNFPFVPAGADGIDDWFVPGQSPGRIAPWSPGTDAFFPDDWIYPDNRNAPTPAAAPSSAPLAPSPQPNAANPAISNRPAPRPDPFAAYWALFPASRVGALAWHPPIFPSSDPFSPQNIGAPAWVPPPPFAPNSFGQLPSATNATSELPPGAGTGGLLGGIPRMLAARARANDPWEAAANGLLGGIAKMIAASAPPDPLSAAGSRGLLGVLANLQLATSNAQADASYPLGSPPFLPPDPIGHQAGSPSYATAGSTDIAPATGSRPQPEEAPAQLAQALPPIFFARPPVLIPRQLAPLEELPPGSVGGPGAGKPFPRSPTDQQSEGVPCTYCGRPTTKEPGPDKLHRDHIVPRIQGGNNTPENVAPACRTCNLEKGPRTPQQWYDWLGGGGAT
jgi:hypothetical protein